MRRTPRHEVAAGPHAEQGEPHAGERQYTGEQHCGEGLDMDVQAGPRTKHGNRSEAVLAGPQRGTMPERRRRSVAA
jgi:hypothetical protein